VQFTTPAGYQFYSADDARAFLQRAGAAPPEGQVLGMVGPSGQQPTAADFWGAVISYQDIGYVPSTRADALSAADFESQTRAARAAAGRPFEAFAVQPAFDPAAPSLSWGERTAADAPGVRNLRHEIRVLGRSGVSGVTVVARNDQLGQVVSAAPALQSMLAYPAGQRYGDRAVGDRTAALDVPGLITGAAAQPAVVAEAASAEGAAPAAAKSGLFSGGIGSVLPWVAAGVVLLAGLGWYIAGRSPRPDDDFDDDEDDGDGDADPRPAPPAPPTA
jgi:uncharacterized membrane-anchored protein